MKGTLYLSGQNYLSKYFDSAVNCYIAVFKSFSNELGLQGRKGAGDYFVNEFISGAAFITETESSFVDNENSNRVMNDITRNKYGFLLHDTNDLFRKYADDFNHYNKKVKILELKKRYGRSVEEIGTPPHGFDLYYGGSEDLKQIYLHSKELCEFISIWPGYWDGYGKHIFLVGKKKTIFERVEACSEKYDIDFMADYVGQLPMS